jgi:hypothetical protein
MTTENKTSPKVPEQDPDEPLGDRGNGDKTWSPEEGNQGISNRVGDEDAEDGNDSSKD